MTLSDQADAGDHVTQRCRCDGNSKEWRRTEIRRDLTNVASGERNLGAIFQKCAVQLHLRAFDVAFPLRFRIFAKEDVESDGLDCGILRDFMERKPQGLSDGLWERASIKRCQWQQLFRRF
ncbi:hypothetical protein [Bradyrhizobium vignae]|uniref:hypothetical protein n=1 Tax=Bradyrhizobium vignae TaxID=1549949 RepID=UPI00135C87D8|nr:hypothetical protein [Bradyrhizobium vignae]